MPLDTNVVINKRQPLAPQVYEIVRAAIVCLACAPGESIGEQVIAERLGISRTPVREALARLAAERLVDVFPQNGTFVAPIHLDAVMEGQFVREALEIQTVRRAAIRFGTRERRQIERILAEQRDCIDLNDDAMFYHWDEMFHQALADAAGVPSCWRIIHGAIGQLDRIRRICLPAPGRLPMTFAEHQAILDGLVSGDPAASEAAMRAHLNAVYSNIELVLEKYGDRMFDSADKLLDEFLRHSEAVAVK